jgi:hypothetical protein
MRIRALKEKVLSLLRAADFENALEEITTLPRGKVLKPLISCLCSCDEVVKWRAVTALGQVVAAMAEADFESARIVMRRFMWALNDESGGIGWGSPEAISEVCAIHPQIAQEYAHMLVSYMREDGFYLELPQLQRGLMWGIGRLAQVNPQLLIEKQVLTYLPPYLFSNDHIVQAGAVYASGLLKSIHAKDDLQALVNDERPMTLYIDRQFTETTLGKIATEALCHLQ